MAGKVTTQVVIEGKNNAGKAFAEADSQFERFAANAKKAGGVIAAALTVGALESWIKTNVDAIDLTGELAERTGMAASEFAGLQYAAKFASIESEGLAAALAKFNQNVGKAAEGTQAQAAAFGKVGVEIRNQEGNIKPLGQLFSEVAGKIAAMPDGVNKSALAIELFGKAGTKLLPLLNMGADGIGRLKQEAADLGVVLEDEVYDAAGKFNDTLDVLETAAQGAGQKFTAELIPALNTVSGLLLEYTKDTNSASASSSAMAAGIKLLASVWFALSAAVTATGRNIGAIMAAIIFVAKGQYSEAANVIKESTLDAVDTVTDAFRRINSTWDEAADKSRESSNEMARGLEGLRASRDQVVKATEAYAKKQIAIEQNLLGQIKKLREERKKIETYYSELYAKLSGTAPKSEPNYRNIQDMKLGAKDALKAGDAEKALKLAREAAEMIAKFQEAGGNTYGLKGVAEELQQIEQNATSLKQSDLERQFLNTSIAVAMLQQQMEALKNVQISIDLPQEQAEKIRAQIQALAKAIGEDMVIQPTVLPPKLTTNTTPGDPDVPMPGYATGTASAPPGMAWVGENGPELMQFRGGEKVFTAEASKRLTQRMAGVSLPGISQSLIDTATGAPGASPGRDLGTVRLDVGGGQTIQLLAEREGFEQILARKARQHGRTKR
ncbi:hypothetical protein [Pseudomonas sp. RIT-PI-AD]|uniref:hypothetical protein n=1 Tax=Pseudomonas sp. RIT-PI-AD TaxID=3035294 RepID=UPI0021D7DBDC|nr:hypothetical protein [Pseudomonas sp. RIT-PI-AD]